MTGDDHAGRWAWAEIDLDAIANNVGVVARTVSPAEVWAVVKADGYGHGSVQVARTAVDAGATGLCVALVSEGVILRQAGLDVPILVLSEQPARSVDVMLEHSLTPSVYSTAYAEVLVGGVRRAGPSVGPVGVHVNVDTGMQRVGVAPDDTPAVLAAVHSMDELRLAGVYTHLACADEPDHAANREQIERFDDVLRRLHGDLARSGDEPPVVHVANSAAALAIPTARRAFVRLGIAMYGVSPGPGVDHLATGLRPAMRLVACVSHLKRVEAGSHVSYGWRHRFERSTTVATVPLGYADGVPRRLGTVPGASGADVLIDGRRHPIVGAVTMDQLMVDVGDHRVAVGDEVVLLGSQGGERVRAEDWAERLGTIGYEIVCGISGRVPRTVRGRPTGP